MCIRKATTAFIHCSESLILSHKGLWGFFSLPVWVASAVGLVLVETRVTSQQYDPLIPSGCLLLGLAWHNTVLQQGQVVIKTAVIPSPARRRRKQRKEATIWRGRQRERDRQTDRGEAGVRFHAWTVGLFSTVREPRFRADVLTVSGSMEGEIPTKRGVQILWEIRPLFNIS